jgi:hypothetical protein
MNGVACNLESQGFKALCEATKEIVGHVEPYSITGSLPLIRELQVWALTYTFFLFSGCIVCTKPNSPWHFTGWRIWCSNYRIWYALQQAVDILVTCVACLLRVMGWNSLFTSWLHRLTVLGIAVHVPTSPFCIMFCCYAIITLYLRYIAEVFFFT